MINEQYLKISEKYEVIAVSASSWQAKVYSSIPLIKNLQA
jgi:hypothetical protein